MLDHLHLDGCKDGDKLGAMLYYDWAYDGTGYKDYVRGVNYPTVKVDLALRITPSDKERTLTISKATGEGFQVVKQNVKVAAGQKEVAETIDIAPLTGYAITVQ